MPISTMPLASTTTISTPTSVCSTPPWPPDQRGAADHDGGDRGEQAALADQRVAEAELGRGQDAAEP